MASHKLPNYLRMHRKRAGLTQAEVAFLLGAHDGTKVSRYERYKRILSLETALKYCAIFREPVTELLAGIYDEFERETIKRARRLSAKVRQSDRNKRVVCKLETLDRIPLR